MEIYGLVRVKTYGEIEVVKTGTKEFIEKCYKENLEIRKCDIEMAKPLYENKAESHINELLGVYKIAKIGITIGA